MLLISAFQLRAQDSTSFELSGYAEVYWAGQQGGADERPEFMYNYTDNGPALNLAFIKGWVKLDCNIDKSREIFRACLPHYLDWKLGRIFNQRFFFSRHFKNLLRIAMVWHA
jgi:hypothetical protein